MKSESVSTVFNIATCSSMPSTLTSQLSFVLTFDLPCKSLVSTVPSYDPESRYRALGENLAERTSPLCLRYVWTMRPPWMSYNMQELSSWPEARRRPEGSTQTVAEAVPRNESIQIEDCLYLCLKAWNFFLRGSGALSMPKGRFHLNSEKVFENI